MWRVAVCSTLAAMIQEKRNMLKQASKRLRRQHRESACNEFLDSTENAVDTNFTDTAVSATRCLSYHVPR